ncbi:hypothetical protein SynPROSU1_00916 [Synechococcus sp. PROS-U-1]|nr:hypothetical protein SynPROSU1_00916 [Synechococcus sp. PROS-U-1]
MGNCLAVIHAKLRIYLKIRATQASDSQYFLAGLFDFKMM